MSTTATLRSAVFPRATTYSKALLVTGGTLFIAGLAQIALPIPGSPVPVTGQTLGVLLIGAGYGSQMGAFTLVSYLGIGVMGAPVFANGQHGLAKLTGPTGGYLIGMLFASLLVGALAGRKWDQRLRTALPTMLLGDAVIFFFGLFWLHAYTHQSWSWTVAAGFTPFLLGEALKIAIACTSLPLVWRYVQR
jgi:biotin transport system substrate-specific component